MSQSNADTVHSIIVELGAGKRGFPPTTLGRSIHALVLKWIQLGDESLAEKVHSATLSPLSLSGLLGYRHKQGIQEGDRFFFRISLLDGHILQPLLRGLEQWGDQPIELAKYPFILRNIYTLPGTHRLAQINSYPILANPSQSLKEITLNFVSPTSFKQKDFIQTFPLPDLVFNNLIKRWNGFAPQEYQLTLPEWQSYVSAYELKTHSLKMEAGAEIGTQGWVKYHFPNPEQAKIATILAHFAFFAGVGRKTSMGMGQVQFSLNSSVSKY